MSEHREKAVEAISRSRYGRTAYVSPWRNIGREKKDILREGSSADLKAADLHLQRMYWGRFRDAVLRGETVDLGATLFRGAILSNEERSDDEAVRLILEAALDKAQELSTDRRGDG